MLKTFMEQEHHKWLDDEEYADRWHGNKEPYSSKKQYLHITNWAGEAYLRKKICLITADGSDDKQIALEGLSNYSISPPQLFLELSTLLPDSNNVGFAESAPLDECV